MTISLTLSFRRLIFAALLGGLSVWLGWQYRLERALVAAGRAEGVPNMLLWSVAMQETRMTPDAVGAAGEIGLMQIMPNTAKHWAELTGQDVPTEEELFRPKLNARIAAWYLREGLEEGKGTQDRLAYALAYYNAGPARARRWQEELPEGIRFEDYIPFSSTRKYVKQVKGRMEREPPGS
jgi:soluble lytic murein transglycosylase